MIWKWKGIINKDLKNIFEMFLLFVCRVFVILIYVLFLDWLIKYKYIVNLENKYIL